MRRVLEVIGADSGLSQAEVGRRTGLCRATVSNLVAELRRLGLVHASASRPGGRGRLEVKVPRAGVVVGVDYGDRHVRVGVADLSGRVLGDEEHPLPSGAGTHERCVAARGLMTRLLERDRIPAGDVLQVGVGVPRSIDGISGRLGGQAASHPWAEVDARAVLEETFELPVMIDNDCNLGALGELRQGAGRGLTDIVYFHAGDRVGAGVVLGGRVHRGAGGTAGEIGHMTVDPHGQICRCGSRGCLETVVGATSFLDQLRAGYGAGLEIGDVIQLAEQGDLRCRRALTDAGRAMGTVAADLCNLLSPQRVVVAGEIFGAGEMILGPLRDTVKQRAVPAAASAVEIVRSHLNGSAEMVGAIWLALDAIHQRAARGVLAAMGPEGGEPRIEASVSLTARMPRSTVAVR
jgi:predicted NBD/HSP70 family sugar kinase